MYVKETYAGNCINEMNEEIGINYWCHIFFRRTDNNCGCLLPNQMPCLDKIIFIWSYLKIHRWTEQQCKSQWIYFAYQYFTRFYIMHVKTMHVLWNQRVTSRLLKLKLANSLCPSIGLADMLRSTQYITKLASKYISIDLTQIIQWIIYVELGKNGLSSCKCGEGYMSVHHQGQWSITTITDPGLWCKLYLIYSYRNCGAIKYIFLKALISSYCCLKRYGRRK